MSDIQERNEKKPSKKYWAKTTWHLQPPPTLELLKQDPLQWIVERISRRDLADPELYEPKSPDLDRGPVPNLSVIDENLFVLRFGLIPIALQWLFVKYSGRTIPELEFSPTRKGLKSVLFYIAQVFIYQFASVRMGQTLLKRIHRFQKQHGTFNEKNRGRDRVPDNARTRIVFSLVLFNMVRNYGVFALIKDRTQLPHFSLSSPIKMGLYCIALDYFFYVYHRATHDFDGLWHIHQQHHATKAPTPSMSLWADDWQDALEWAIVPALAYAVVPLNLAELYLTSLYVSMVEAMGHSGIRAIVTHPILTPILVPLGMELTIEDHDLHHRYGRGGKNFGKQTRIWDVLFGTAIAREEGPINGF